MKQHRGKQVEAPARPEPLPVVDMVDDTSVHSEFSYLTGDSEGNSTVALSNVQVAIYMASEPATVVPQPKAPARKEVVVTPTEVATSAVPSHPVVSTVLPKQVCIPIVSSMTQSTVATKDIPKEPHEVVVSATPANFGTCCHSAPITTSNLTSDTQILRDYVTGSVPGHFPDHFPTNTSRATCGSHHGSRRDTGAKAPYSH